MIHSLRIARKRGKIVCRNCGTRVMPGMGYIRIERANYCVLCDGPGRDEWEKLK